MKLLFIVVNAGFAEDVIEIARESGLRGATILNARGEGVHHESFMGITVDTEKEMILSIIEENTGLKVMEALKEKVGVYTPAHSICFLMPIEKITGLDADAYAPQGDN